MSRTFTHKTDESTLTTLCPRCLNAFRNARGIRVRRADPYQLTKEPCTYCQTNFGYDYYIQLPARNPPTLRRDGSMMNLNALKIDPEFQGKIPPLTFEELNQLEANILRDGRIINLSSYGRLDRGWTQPLHHRQEAPGDSFHRSREGVCKPL